jgi:hypothetical protein
MSGTIDVAVMAAWSAFLLDPSSATIEALAAAVEARPGHPITRDQTRELLAKLVPVVEQMHRLHAAMPAIQAEAQMKVLLAQLMGGAE